VTRSPQRAQVHVGLLDHPAVASEREPARSNDGKQDQHEESEGEDDHHNPSISSSTRALIAAVTVSPVTDSRSRAAGGGILASSSSVMLISATARSAEFPTYAVPWISAARRSVRSSTCRSARAARGLSLCEATAPTVRRTSSPGIVISFRYRLL